MAKSDLSRRLRRRHFAIVVVTMLIISTWIPLLQSDGEKDKSQLPPFWVRPPEFDKGNKRPTLPLRNNVSSSVEERAIQIVLPPPLPPPPTYGYTDDDAPEINVRWDRLPNEATYLTPFQEKQARKLARSRLYHCYKFLKEIQNFRCSYYCPRPVGKCCTKNGKCSDTVYTRYTECVCLADEIGDDGRAIYRPHDRVWMEWMKNADPLERDERCKSRAECDDKCPIGTKGRCEGSRCECKDNNHYDWSSAVPLSTALELWRDPCNLKLNLFPDACQAECPCTGVKPGVCAGQDGRGHGDFCHCGLPVPNSDGQDEYVRLKVAKRRCACNEKSEQICCDKCRPRWPAYNDEVSPPTYDAPKDVDDIPKLSTGDNVATNAEEKPTAYYYAN